MNYSPAFEKLNSRITAKEMQKMLNEMSLYKIYTSLQVSDRLLLRYIKHHNLTFKKSFKTIKDLSSTEKEHIIDDWVDSLLTKRAIAKKYSIGPTTLKQLFKEYGVENRNKAISNPQWIDYRKLVDRLTKVVLRHHKLSGMPGYEWDHKFSVYDGFHYKISPNIIAARENLELIPIADNRSCGEVSSVTRDELYKLIGL